MGSKSNTLENALLLHIFNNAAIAGIGDASGLQPSAAAGSLYVALMTSASVCDDANDGTEAAYTGYARVAVARTAGGWSVVGNQASNVASILFGVMTAGGPVISRYACVYTAASLGTRLYWGQFPDDLIINNGIAPEFDPGTMVFIED